MSEAILSKIRALLSERETWGIVYSIGEYMVIVGVAGELLDVFPPFVRRFRRWRRRVAVASIVVLIAGLLVEKHAGDKREELSDAHVALLTREAARLTRETGRLDRKTARLNKEAGEARERAAQTELQAQEARLHAAHAESRMDRREYRLYGKARSTLVALLEPRAGQHAVIYRDPYSWERIGFAWEIFQLLFFDSKWTVPMPSVGSAPPPSSAIGVIIDINAQELDTGSEVGKKLMESAVALEVALDGVGLEVANRAVDGPHFPPDPRFTGDVLRILVYPPSAFAKDD